MLFGGIEAGGTKFVCAVGTGAGEIVDEIRFPTTTPGETIRKAINFFESHDTLASIGIGTFGPIDPDPKSPHYGTITTTPKPGWANTDLVSPIRTELHVPIGFDTDVNAAALGEHNWGAAQGLDTFVYLTIGTGIGGGAMVGGQLLHGAMHPEMGHMLLRRDPERDPFEGICPYHGDCLEGLASGPAMEARWNQRGETLPIGHPAWALEAHYLALGLVNIITVLSPHRIILGGGVMESSHLFPMIRNEVRGLLNDYLQIREILEDIDSYIVSPGLGNKAGVMGAIGLAQIAANA
jgi:fructokinase